MEQLPRETQETAEVWRPYLEREFEEAQSRNDSLGTEISRLRAENLRLKVANNQLLEQANAHTVSSTDDDERSDRTHRSKSAEERHIVELEWRLGNLEETMKKETEDRHQQLETATARLGNKIAILGSHFDFQQQRLRDMQERGLTNVANAVRDFVRPLEASLAESEQDSTRRGDIGGAQRDREQLVFMRSLVARLLDTLQL